MRSHWTIIIALVCLIVGAGAGYLYSTRGLSEARDNIRAATDRNRELLEHVRSAARNGAELTKELTRAEGYNQQLKSQLDENDRLLEELGGTVETLRHRFTLISSLVDEGAEIVNGIVP